MNFFWFLSGIYNLLRQLFKKVKVVDIYFYFGELLLRSIALFLSLLVHNTYTSFAFSKAIFMPSIICTLALIFDACF